MAIRCQSEQSETAIKLLILELYLSSFPTALLFQVGRLPPHITSLTEFKDPPASDETLIMCFRLYGSDSIER